MTIEQFKEVMMELEDDIMDFYFTMYQADILLGL